MTEPFESLEAALRGLLEWDFAELPPQIQSRVESAFQLISWDDLTPERRRYVAKVWDVDHDPAAQAERERGFVEGFFGYDPVSLLGDERQELADHLAAAEKNRRRMRILQRQAQGIEGSSPEFSAQRNEHLSTDLSLQGAGEEIWLFRKVPDGWEVGPVGQPIRITTRKKKGYHYLRHLIRTCPGEISYVELYGKVRGLV